MKKIILILSLIFIGSTLTIFAQSKKLHRQEFYTPIRAADDMKLKTSRRVKMTLKVYSGGVLKSTTTEIKEFILPDKERHIEIEEEDGKTEKSELIKIGTTFYLKKNDSKWIKEENMELPMSFLGIPATAISEYSVEDSELNNKPVKIYRHYSVYDAYNPKEDEEKKTFWDQKTWIDERGMKIKEEIAMGKPISKEVFAHRLFEYKYNPTDLKIEAPIK